MFGYVNCEKSNLIILFIVPYSLFTDKLLALVLFFFTVFQNKF